MGPSGPEPGMVDDVTGPAAADGPYHAAIGVRPGRVAPDWPMVLDRLVPGAHLVLLLPDSAWRATAAAEEAGFEVRDSLLWVTSAGVRHLLLARRPLVATVVANVIGHAAGALNIDGCRVGLATDVPSVHAVRGQDYPKTYDGTEPGWGRSRGGIAGDRVDWEPAGGRWPPNMVFSHAPDCHPLRPIVQGWEVLDWACGEHCPIGDFDREVGRLKSGAPGTKRVGNRGVCYGAESRPPGTPMPGYGDEGGPSRFFPGLPAGDWWLAAWLRHLVVPPAGRLLVIGDQIPRAPRPRTHPAADHQESLALFA